MINFVKKIRECDFVDLLVAIKKMKYGDIKNCEYMDKENYRTVRVLDCSPFIVEHEAEQNFIIDDFNISEQEVMFDYYLFMLKKFDDEWYEKAKKYLTIKQDAHALETLEQAKNTYEADLETDSELFATLN